MRILCEKAILVYLKWKFCWTIIRAVTLCGIDCGPNLASASPKDVDGGDGDVAMGVPSRGLREKEVNVN